MKRVYCLYRVSTIGQVEKDDIPMQRQACHEFAYEKGWQIIEEFAEKGISGYKRSADQREALQKLKQAAVQKKFDVLLVFMFDRLGRRDDETPFIVEWFVKSGIEVWSVMEGEQRFEDHVDKLLKYICINKSSLHPCNGQRSYSVNLVDNLVRRQLQAALFSDVVLSSAVNDHTVVQRLDELKLEIEQEQANLEVLQAEVVEAFRGSSAFSSTLLNDLLQKSESKLLLLKAELAEIKEEVRRHKVRWFRLIYLRQEILSEHIRSLDTLPLSHQQEVARALISRVELGRNRAVNIEWTFGGTACLGSDAGA